MLDEQALFALDDTTEPNVPVCFELNGFKPFNYTCGFCQDDWAILLLADLLQKRLQSECAFIAHASGNNFYVIVRNPMLEGARSQAKPCYAKISLRRAQLS